VGRDKPIVDRDVTEQERVKLPPKLVGHPK